MKIKSLLLFFSLLSFENALACASCGSGGDDPLILYPNESQKVYLGVSRTSNFESADPSGKFESTNNGPKNKTQVQLSYGKSFNPRSFLTVGIPLIANSHSRNAEYSYGDPMLSGRYTVLPMTLENEYSPQIQLLASLKPALARSVHESKESDGLDVFGNGYHQLRAGLDLWSGMTWLQYGLAQTVGLSMPKTVSDHKLQAGMEYRTVLSLGHTIEDAGKLVLGLSRLFVDQKKDQDVIIADSEQVNHSVFFTGEYFVDSTSTMRLTIARQAALFNNRNTLRSDSLTLAYMRSF